MESLVLSVMEVVQELLRDTRITLIGLAAIVVSLLGLMTGRRLASGLFDVAAPGQEAAPADGNDEREVVPEFLIPTSHTVTGKIAAIRWTLRSLGLAGIAVFGLLVTLEKYGAEPILLWSLAKVEPRTGIRVTFDSATGGPLSGRFVLHHVHLVRANHPESNFDLTCSQVTARCSLWKILRPNTAFDGLHIEQVSGTYDRLRPAPQAPAPVEIATDRQRSRGSSQIGYFEVTGATITYTDSSVDGDPVQIALEIDSLKCAPVRAASAPFDLIFRSNVTGTLDERPFVIQTTQTPAATQTEWRATGLPIALIRAYLEGPFRWLQSGECDVSVVQKMPHDLTLPVILESHLILRDVRPGVPADTKPAVAVAAQLLIAQMKRLPREKDIGITLKIDPAKFDLTKTEDRAQLWKQYKAAAVAGLLQSTPIKIDGVPDETNEKLENAVDTVTNRAIKAIENIRIRRQARKAAKEGKGGRPAAPPPPE